MPAVSQTTLRAENKVSSVLCARIIFHLEINNACRELQCFVHSCFCSPWRVHVFLYTNKPYKNNKCFTPKTLHHAKNI